MDEEWKDVAGYEGLYRVSNLGNVYSNYTHRNLKPHKRKDGYMSVSLFNDTKSKRHLVHRLVAEAFIENPNNFPIINHKDETPSNNCVNNLEWCDFKYNNTYNDVHIRRAKKTSIHVYSYGKDGKLVNEYKSVQDAHRKTGFSSGNIAACCNNKMYASNDIVWSYTKLSVEEINYKFNCYEKNKNLSYNIGSYAKEIKSKKVGQYDLDGNFIQSFPSTQEAGKQLGFSPSLIGSVCRGEHKQTHGYVFKYA